MRSENDLGRLVNTYRARKMGRADMLTLGVPFVVIESALLGYGLWLAIYSILHYGLIAATEWSQFWFILAGFTFGLFLLILLYRLYQAHFFVAVCKGGVRLNLRRGLSLGLSRPYQLTWGEIAGIATDATRERFFGKPGRQRLRATLYPNVGKPIKLDDRLENLPELVSHIKASLYPRLLPSLRSSFEAGQWIYFGEIAIQRQNVRFDRASSASSPSAIPWSSIQSISIQSGYLMVEFKGNSTFPDAQQIPVSHIPNLELLLQLVQQGVTT
jgi:hypothetical protein